MNPLSPELLKDYWSAPALAANALIFANILYALLLGLVVGYERNFHGRAAGMRTYGLVCMASAALTSVCGYSTFWFGGHGNYGSLVPTQVIQGIVTGVGFLGAGVILKEGMHISGLTTAASIWSSCSIGILVGVGFYGSATVLAFLTTGCILYAGRLENILPACPAVAVSLDIDATGRLETAEIVRRANANGFDMAPGSLNIFDAPGQRQWRFVLVAYGRNVMAPLPELADALRAMAGVIGVQVQPTRH